MTALPVIQEKCGGTECRYMATTANPAKPLHPCPYKSEINDNETDLCNCCDECRRECADDI